MQTDIVIIGSGPAGLALGHYLAQRGQSFVILEKGEAAQTWAEISPDLTLLTPWWLSAPLRSEILHKPAFEKIQAGEYYRHLSTHAVDLATHIRTGHHVTSVRRLGDKFTVNGNFVSIACNKVVASSGYYSAPYIPELPSDGSIPVIHAGHYQSVRSLLDLDRKRILIVGRRITAGQALEQLHDAGHHLAIAARDAKVVYQRLRKPSTFLETGYYLAEYGLLSLIPKGIKMNTYPGMSGGRPRALIESGTVPVFRRPVSVAEGAVHFEGGAKQEFDWVIFATGYRPALSYIDELVDRSRPNGLPATKGFECLAQPGLYLLGFDNLIDLRSRSFRGIRADARVLANILRTR